MCGFPLDGKVLPSVPACSHASSCIMKHFQAHIPTHGRAIVFSACLQRRIVTLYHVCLSSLHKGVAFPAQSGLTHEAPSHVHVVGIIPQ